MFALSRSGRPMASRQPNCRRQVTLASAAALAGNAGRRQVWSGRDADCRRVVGHLGETDAAGTAILDLDGTDDDDLALVTASATRAPDHAYCGRRLWFHRPRPVRRTDCGSMPPCCGAAWRRSANPLVQAESELALQLQVPRCRWKGSPSDRAQNQGGQRQLGMLHDGAGSPTSADGSR
jgi:hypothetical protein